jgi:hypothetical protein
LFRSKSSGLYFGIGGIAQTDPVAAPFLADLGLGGVGKRLKENLIFEDMLCSMTLRIRLLTLSYKQPI